MSEMSEQCRSKVGWENVGNVGAKSEQGGLGKCRSRVGWENKWYMTGNDFEGKGRPAGRSNKAFRERFASSDDARGSIKHPTSQ